MVKHSLSKDKIKILLLEGVHDNAIQEFKDLGYTNIEALKVGLDEDQLIKKIQGVHVLGIRSRTRVTERVLAAANGEEFESPLRNLPNVILTPHIGGSTLEAQANIGLEVAEKLIKYSDNGSTVGAVNFPEVSLPVKAGGTRFLHIHKNLPGMMRRLNEIFSSRDLNISAQYLQTDAEIGYVVVDVDGDVDETELMAELTALDGTTRARFLF